MGGRKRGVLWAWLGVMLFTTTAWAGGEEEARAPVRLGLSLGAAFPIAHGAEAQLELPGRLYLAGGVGGMPSSFQRLVNETAIKVGAWPADLGTFAVDHVGRTSVVGGSLGWRPFAEKGGFFVELNAMRLELSLSAFTSEVMSTFAPGTSPAVLSDGTRQAARVNLDLTMDLVGGQVGWMWDLDPFYLRLGVGGLAAIRASSRASIDWSDGSNSSLGLVDEVTQRWSGLLLKNARIPTASLKLGLRFF
jgi:hypothetical protein